MTDEERLTKLVSELEWALEQHSFRWLYEKLNKQTKYEIMGFVDEVCS